MGITQIIAAHHGIIWMDYFKKYVRTHCLAIRLKPGALHIYKRAARLPTIPTHAHSIQ
jgi:hypothetical protein